MVGLVRDQLPAGWRSSFLTEPSCPGRGRMNRSRGATDPLDALLPPRKTGCPVTTESRASQASTGLAPGVITKSTLRARPLPIGRAIPSHPIIPRTPPVTCRTDRVISSPLISGSAGMSSRQPRDDNSPRIRRERISGVSFELASRGPSLGRGRSFLSAPEPPIWSDDESRRSGIEG